MWHPGSRRAGTSRGGKKAGRRDGRSVSWSSLAADPWCDISERGAVAVAGIVYSQVPREPGSRVFLTPESLTVTSLRLSQTYLTQVASGQRNLPRNTCSEGSTSGPVAPSRGASSRPGSISFHGKGRTCLGLANQPVLCHFQEAPTKDPASPLLLLVLGRMSSGSLRQKRIH